MAIRAPDEEFAAIEEMRAAARRTLPSPVWEFLESGAGTGSTLRANREAFGLSNHGGRRSWRSVGSPRAAARRSAVVAAAGGSAVGGQGDDDQHDDHAHADEDRAERDVAEQARPLGGGPADR
jgi:hypothetical protein